MSPRRLEAGGAKFEFEIRSQSRAAKPLHRVAERFKGADERLDVDA